MLVWNTPPRRHAAAEEATYSFADSGLLDELALKACVR
jgi:hypothetical protein